MEAKPLSCLGFEPDMVQVLIHNAIDENGPDSFVGIRQATIYALMYWGIGRFEEVKKLELRQICKKGASLKISILKVKENQTRKLQRYIIHPNSLHHKAKMCPVYLIDSYLVHRKNLGHNLDRDYLFPQVGAKFERVFPTYYVTIQIPKVTITYDNYRRHLKGHLNCETFKAMGVYPEDYYTPSFRQGGLSVSALKPYEPMTSCLEMIRQRVGALSIREIQDLSPFSYPQMPLKFHPQM